VSGVTALGKKARRRLHRRSPSSIERCIFAHEAVDDEPTPALFHAVELEPRVNRRLSMTRSIVLSRFSSVSHISRQAG
jgi:hypothetical protein